MLDQAVAIKSDPCTVGNDPSFDISLIAPTPFVLAIQTICRQQGWCHEACMQGRVKVAKTKKRSQKMHSLRTLPGLFALTGFLEHEGTRLRMNQAEKHARAPTIAGIFGSQAPRRKSSMQKWMLDLLECDELPDGLRSGKCLTSDGTLRGHRNNLFHYKRSGLFTSEISETYKTTFTDPAIPLAKLASKTHLNKWLHIEFDKSIVGAYVDDNPQYAFFHWCIGHVQPVMEVMSIAKSSEVGFPKRLHMCFKNTRPPCIPEQSTTESQRLLTDFVRWMAQNNTATEQDIVCDKFAQGWYKHIGQAVDDFQERTADLHPAWEQKLDYMDTDILRCANVVGRMRQFLAQISQIAPQENHIGILEVQYGIHSWCRQLEYYAALIEEAKKSSGKSPVSVPSHPDKSHLVMKWVVTTAPSSDDLQHTKEIRKKLKNRLGSLCEKGGDDKTKKKQADGPANTLVEAVDRLAAAKLIDIEQTDQKARGHLARQFRKRKWCHITESASALELCSQLACGSEHFPM